MTRAALLARGGPGAINFYPAFTGILKATPQAYSTYARPTKKPAEISAGSGLSDMVNVLTKPSASTTQHTQLSDQRRRICLREIPEADGCGPGAEVYERLSPRSDELVHESP